MSKLLGELGEREEARRAARASRQDRSPRRNVGQSRTGNHLHSVDASELTAPPATGATGAPHVPELADQPPAQSNAELVGEPTAEPVSEATPEPTPGLVADRAVQAPRGPLPSAGTSQVGDTGEVLSSAVTAFTVSLDLRTEEELEKVRTAGRFARPKVDANRSATLRLAVAMLSEQLSPEEIVAELARRRPADQQRVGRPRL